jgi:hypothetical protein
MTSPGKELAPEAIAIRGPVLKRETGKLYFLAFFLAFLAFFGAFFFAAFFAIDLLLVS